MAADVVLISIEQDINVVHAEIIYQLHIL